MAIELWMILTLSGVGLFVGFLSGLFGIGGGFITTPALILLGFTARDAIGCTMGFTLGTGLIGVNKHYRLGNVQMPAMIAVATGSMHWNPHR